MPTDSLTSLLKEIEKLEPENVSLLQKEFIIRGESEYAEIIEKFINSKTSIGSVVQVKDVNVIIAKRIKLGESPESIRMDLKSQGLDIDKLIQEDLNNSITPKKIRKTIAQLKEKGLDEKSIKVELSKVFGLSEKEYQEFLLVNRKRGKNILVIGVILTIVGGFFITMTAQSREMEFSAITIISSLAGVGMIIGGIREMRKK